MKLYNTIKILLQYFILVIPLTVFSQIPERPYLFFPKKIPEYRINYSLGLTIARLPRPIVEEELDQSPMIDFHLRMGLPLNFSLDSRINTIAITNHVSAGIFWSFSSGKFSFSIGDNAAFWFGWASFFDFDVRVQGLMDYPAISAGYDFNKILLTLRLEAEYLFYMKSYSGNILTNDNKSRMTGFSAALYSEQELLKNKWITLGFKLRYTRYFYQSWISFSTLNQWFWAPEINLSYIP